LQISIHLVQDRRKHDESLNAGLPILLGRFLNECFTLERTVVLQPVSSLHNLQGIRGSSQYLGQQLIGVAPFRPQETLAALQTIRLNNHDADRCEMSYKLGITHEPLPVDFQSSGPDQASAFPVSFPGTTEVAPASGVEKRRVCENIFFERVVDWNAAVAGCVRTARIWRRDAWRDIGWRTDGLAS